MTRNLFDELLEQVAEMTSFAAYKLAVQAGDIDLSKDPEDQDVVGNIDKHTPAAVETVAELLEHVAAHLRGYPGAS